MNRIFTGLVLVILVGSGWTASAFPGGKNKVKPTKEWNGSVADENLIKDVPTVIVSAKSLETLWKSWKLEGKMPEVDFDKELVTCTTSRGSRLNIFLTLDEKGNLQVGGFGTRDLRPGFRYVLASVPRMGVKTVNGKELPKE